MSKFITPTLLMLLLTLLLLTASPAFAYIGPGAGISVLGSLLSILATIVVAIGAIIFWPLRKYLKRRKARRESVVSMDAVSQGDDKNHANSSDANRRETDKSGANKSGANGSNANGSNAGQTGADQGDTKRGVQD